VRFAYINIIRTNNFNNIHMNIQMKMIILCLRLSVATSLFLSHFSVGLALPYVDHDNSSSKSWKIQITSPCPPPLQLESPVAWCCSQARTVPGLQQGTHTPGAGGQGRTGGSSSQAEWQSTDSTLYLPENWEVAFSTSQGEDAHDMTIGRHLVRLMYLVLK